MTHLPTTMVSGLRLLLWLCLLWVTGKPALASDPAQNGPAQNGPVASEAVLLEFSSKNCQYCVAMQPVTQQLTQEGIAIRHVDVDKEPALAVRYSVRHLPTYVIISGGKEAARLVGKQPIEMVRQALAASQAVHLTPTNAPAPRNLTANSTLAANSDLAANTASTQSATIPTTPSVDAFASGAPLTRLASVDAAANAGTVAPSPVSPNPASPPSVTTSPSITTSTEEAIARAATATVRLRIFEEDGIGFGIGTGTVIDARAGEYLIMTCGHLFRDSNGKGRVEVDVFQGGQSVTVPGQIVDYDAADRDIGLVSMRTDIRITPVPVLPESEAVRNGDSVFSFGCDRGANPSRRDTRITGIDKYNQHLDLSNLEIAGAPVIGRSGGGLFDKQGRLIGVCNAADYNDDIGIYAGPGEVYWQLGRVGMETLAAASSPSSIAAPASITDTYNDKRVAQNANPVQQSQGGLQDSLLDSTSNGVVNSTSSTINPNGEIILIYRDRSQPSAPAQVKVIDKPTSDLLDLLRR